jgi:hypothetical protein
MSAFVCKHCAVSVGTLRLSLSTRPFQNLPLIEAVYEVFMFDRKLSERRASPAYVRENQALFVRGRGHKYGQFT